MSRIKRNLIITVLAIVSLVCGAFAFAACDGDGKPTRALQYKDMGDYYEVSKLGITPSKNIVIPDTYNGKPVKSIGGGAFFRHTGITSVSIPNSIESIGDGAFRLCNSLMTITIPASVTKMGWDVFSDCDLLTIYCEAATRPEGYSVKTLPEEEDYVEWNSNRPVVWNCKNNDVADDGNIYAIIGDIKYSLKGGNATVEMQSENLSGKITIPQNVKYKKNSYKVTAIGDNAFNNRRQVTDITIPDSVTSIGNYAFYYTYGLKSSLTVPDSVKTVGDYAFGNCSMIKSIPSGLTSMGEGAFSWCSGLESATIPNGVTEIGDKMFENSHGLKSVIIPDSVTTIGSSVFNGCSELASITIGNGVTAIDAYAFAWCIKLTSVTLPDKVASIGDGAFNYCSALASITFGKSVTAIGNRAFDECSALATVNFKGTAEDWDKISIGDSNTCLTDATRNYI